MDYNSACWTCVVLFQILHQTTSAKGMQALCHSSGIDKVTIAQATCDVSIDIPEFYLSGQHLWCLLQWCRCSCRVSVEMKPPLALLEGGFSTGQSTDTHTHTGQGEKPRCVQSCAAAKAKEKDGCVWGAHGAHSCSRLVPP